MKPGGCWRGKPQTQLPFALVPGIGLGGADHLSQIGAGHGWRPLGLTKRLLDQFGGNALAGLKAQHTTVLHTMGTQMARQRPGVNLGNRHRAVVTKVLRQRGLAAEVRRQRRHVSDDQPCGVDAIGFGVFVVAAHVADVGVGQRHNLLGVAGIGKNFLVACERGVKHHFTHRTACCTN